MRHSIENGVTAPLGLNIHKHVVTLSEDALNKVLNAIPESAKQARRLVSYLAKHSLCVTVEVNQACSIGNISDVARKINPTLAMFGLKIDCFPPVEKPLNKFNEPTDQHLWALFSIAGFENLEAANDSK